MDDNLARKPSVASTVKNPGPRVRLAAKLYGSGIAKNKKEASRMAGIHPNYLTVLRDNEVIRRIQGDAYAKLDFATGDMNHLLTTLGRKALATIDSIRENGEKEENRLKAAVDLADRSPETSKIQKHQLESISLQGEDVNRLVQTLVEAARIERDFSHVHQGSYSRVGADTVVPVPELPTPKDPDEPSTER